MEAIYELRVRFGEEAEDIVASEVGDTHLQIEQGDDMIIIPKASAGSFVDAISAWVSNGGRVACA